MTFRWLACAETGTRLRIGRQMQSDAAVNEAVSAIVTGTSIPTVTKENQEQFRSQQPVTVLTFTAPWPNTEHMSPPQPPQLYVQ
jgi:hypothetical protein